MSEQSVVLRGVYFKVWNKFEKALEEEYLRGFAVGRVYESEVNDLGERFA